MIKKGFMYFATAIVAVLSVSCNKEVGKQSGGLNLAGDWQLVDVDFVTKSAVIGDQTVTVYLRLSADGAFALWQQLGQGRFQEFSGSWDCKDNVLSGKYSDGKSWGSDYEVSMEDGFLILSVLPGRSETYTYSHCTIPDTLQ